MADNFLNAFGIGASLADRARNFQLQTAELALRQQAQDLNSQKTALALQSQGYALQHQQEQDRYLAEDLPKIQDWQKNFLQWNAKGDPTAPFPQPPSDLKSLNGLKQVGDMSQSVLSVLPMAQNRYFAQQATHQTLGQINDDVKFALDHGMGDVVLENNSGLGDNGKPDLTRWRAIQQAIAPERKRQQAMKDEALVATTGSKFSKEQLDRDLAAGRITQEQHDKFFATARTEGGVAGQKANAELEAYRKQGLITSPDDETAARQILLGPSGGKLDTETSKSVNGRSEAATQLRGALDDVKAFNQKYNNSFEDYVGPVDHPLFSLKGRAKGLSPGAQEEAKKILGNISLVVQNYRKGLYGSALTSTEKGEFEQAVGSANRADYLTGIEGLANSLERSLNTAIKNHRYSPDIQVDVKKKYAPEIFASGQSQAKPSFRFNPQTGDFEPVK